jgi:hypothetical protein
MGKGEERYANAANFYTTTAILGQTLDFSGSTKLKAHSLTPTFMTTRGLG